MIKFKSIFVLLFALLNFISFAQKEMILSYDVQLEVTSDRSLKVTEFIKVYSMGQRIKRGITRDFPNKRYLKGQKISTEYEVTEVLKDGQEEPYFIKNKGDKEILYIGQKNLLLEEGIYTYTIRYHVPNQIGIYGDYDELYWNAIGTDVQFIIKNASCKIIIPRGVSINQEAAYIGRRGDNNKSYTLTKDNEIYHYQINRALAPGEGLTIGLGFDKGFFDQPSKIDRYGTFMVILFGLLLLIPYFIYTWWKYGQDPESPSPYPIFEVPDGLSVASASYIIKERYSKKSLVGSVIHLATKGFLKIDQEEGSNSFLGSTGYILTKTSTFDQSQLPEEEFALMTDLFSNGNQVVLDGKYKAHVKRAYSNHQSSLRSQHRAFVQEGNNSKMLILPIIISILIILLAYFLLLGNPYAAGFNMTILIIFVPSIIFGLILYHYLIKKPTMDKLILKSEIEGYKMYLELSEKDRLNLSNPPNMTPEHFEEALPYAFALGVENDWTESFKSVLDKASYRPKWSGSSLGYMYLTSGFGNNFSNRMSSTATQPAPSGGSGSGGGGFSGGGGGGGGVGGW